MEGSIVDQGQRAGRLQQLNHDPPPETSYPMSDDGETRCLRDLSGIRDRGPGERLPRSEGNNALTKWVTPARDRFRDRERTALDHNDKLALDELEMFRKDVSTYLRQYDFLSQIVDYEDPAPEKLSIYLRHLAPVITTQQLNHEIDLSTSRTADAYRTAIAKT